MTITREYKKIGNEYERENMRVDWTEAFGDCEAVRKEYGGGAVESYDGYYGSYIYDNLDQFFAETIAKAATYTFAVLKNGTMVLYIYD